MLKHIRNLNFRSKLLLAFSLIIIIPITINSYVSYERMKRFAEGKWISYARNLTHQINTSIDNYFINVDLLSSQVAYSDNVQDWLNKSYQEEGYDYAVDSAVAARFLEGMRVTSVGVNQISIYNKSDGLVYGFSTNRNVDSSYKITQEPWFENVKETHGEKIVIGPYPMYSTDSTRSEIVSLVRKIKDLNTVQDLGYLVVDVEISKMLVNYFKDISQDKENNIYVVNNNGVIIYNNLDNAQIGKALDPDILTKISQSESDSILADVAGQSSLITYYTSALTDWKVVNFTSRDSLLLELNINRINAIVLSVTLIMAAMLVSILISNSVVNPIRKTRDLIAKIEQGNFGETIEVTQMDEIGMFQKSFNNMSVRLKSLINEIYNKENDKRKAEIVALQAQINPHFTYNTLSTIKQMADVQKIFGISRMIESLINLLQASAKFSDKLITVEQELDLLKSYIFIQEARYCGKFSVEYDYDPSVLQNKTLNLILQPIVENSIFHGISKKSGLGKITIRIKEIGQTLQYIIEDDGVGIPRDQIEQTIYKQDKNKFERLGISNVNTRIKLNFGEEYGLRIESEENVGTKVTVTIPII